MRRLLAAIDVRDVGGIAGFGLLVYGVSEINREAAFITAGALLLGFAVAAARK